jgi:hypothetical protein
VGLVRQNIDIVNWISHSSQEWSPLIDKEFHQLITNWKKSFWHNVEIKSRSPYGDKARFKFQKTLPINGYVFSGIKVEIAANMGGNFPQAYWVKGLTKIDWDLCINQELIISDKDFSYTIICSHEEGYETYYEKSV